MMPTHTIDGLMQKYQWRPIPDCPGRFVLNDPDGSSQLEHFMTANLSVTEHRSATARDVVLVANIDGGGLITYLRSDGTMLHTLGDSAGHSRKLQQLGIAY